MVLKHKPKVLITGWFTFESPHNTAGDLLARQVLIDWLVKAGYEYRIGVFRPNSKNEVNIDLAKATDYLAIVFVCGPITSGHVTPLMRKFSSIKRIAVNVSVVPTSDLNNEFDEIIARDGTSISNPDIVLLSNKNKAPVVGVIYAGRQKEYPNQEHDKVQKIIEEVLNKHDIAVVNIDTKLPGNEFGLKSIGQIESVIGRMDAIITTRLHGTVLSLRNSVPVISIDPVPNGAKVSSQVTVLGWTVTCKADQLTEEWLETALAKVLETDMSHEVSVSIENGLKLLQKVKKQLIAALGADK